ncbi:S9 family peptidase [Kordiimonas sp. SCSIO 12610]|uniref:alpha/beta hydrolase family protein n=1 Tax=Kordiimonas sp. SCSIO 12610 TaxID=2829597 RepID=UPI00210B66D9|nr:prolyl oligopeptidase family serine peptidase [Kordiimonas sp. SCSIO 12610]UTW55045.1 S9 family peptidase [Kordiimonas sp. SCSIO 12610]
MSPHHFVTKTLSSIIYLTIISCIFTNICIAQDNTKAPPILPVEAFASLPDLSQMKLSPDGKMVGYVIEYEGRKAVVAQTVEGENKQLIPAPDGGDFDTFYWINDKIILLQLSGTIYREEFGREVAQSRLFSFNLKNRKFKWLGKPKRSVASASANKVESFASQIENIVDLLPKDPKHILVAMDFDLDAETSVYRVNVENGKRKEIQKNLRGYQNWYTNQNSEIVYGTGYDGSTYKVKFKQPNGKWINLKKTEWYKRFKFEDFTNDPNIIYVSGRNAYGTDSIFTLDLRSGEPVEEIFKRATVDIGGMVYHPITGKVAGVYYTDDFTRVKYFDKDLSIVQRSMQKALKGMIVSITSMSKDETKYLIYAENDRDPGTYYLYDRKNKQLNYISPAREPIYAEQMATAKMLKIPVRDGSTISAVITMPAGRKAQNMPSVILPHGGPHVAGDSAHWDFWAQFYANRGYIVLQPNFRGTSGYGTQYLTKGILQWGGLMQDDVTDATKWLITEGYADPERICIAGASYGGYAALMGAIKEPGLYKCAISVNGVTDLPRLKSTDKNQSVGGSAWIKRMGLRGADDKTVSPHDRADEINIPVLLMSSVDDTRIDYRMSRSTHTKLTDLGKDSTYIKINDGTHNMVTKASRMTLLKETEKFLAKHIGD